MGKKKKKNTANGPGNRTGLGGGRQKMFCEGKEGTGRGN